MEACLSRRLWLAHSPRLLLVTQTTSTLHRAALSEQSSRMIAPFAYAAMPLPSDSLLVRPTIDRRQQPRSYSDLSAAICILETKTRFTGRILDLTADGLGLFSPAPLEHGAAISIRYRGVLILAEVAYCIPTGGGYRVGAKIDQAIATVNAELSVSDVEIELRSLPTEEPTTTRVSAAHA